MDDWFKMTPPVERRAHPRYEILAHVRLRHGDVTHVMDVRDISRGGLFVKATSGDQLRRFPLGRRVDLEIFTTEDLENVKISGTVVRIVETIGPQATGFGVQFGEIGEVAAAALDRLIEKAAAGTLRPPPLPPGHRDPD